MNKKLSESIKLAYKLGRKQAFQPNPPKRCPDVEKLKHLYVDLKYGSHRIAKEFGGGSQTLILKWLKEANVPIRTLSESASIVHNGFKEGSKHHLWKGDEVSYPALHTWVRNHKGTPQKCDHCGTTNKRKYEWANISGEYRRDLDDWVRLCTSCHRYFDNGKKIF